MPGITLEIASHSVDLTAFQKGQVGMLHAPDYKTTVRLSAPTMVVGSVAYPEYPVWFADSAAGLVGLEGRIYNRSLSSVRSSLVALADQLLASTAPEKLVSDWVQQHDGEYIGLVVARDASAALIFTDPLGRLPLYYRATENDFVAARECKFVATRTGRTNFDPIAWAECLWIEHPFGDRTLFAGISHLAGGNLLQVRRGGDSLSVSRTKMCEFNFEEERSPGARLSDQASVLVERFTEAARQRGTHSETGTNLVSLSGGQDSRAVAAALVRAGVSCNAASFVASDGAGAPDARIAERIAAKLGIPWNRIDIPSPTPAEESRLLTLKDGLNSLGMAFILPFMDAIVQRWGRRATYITGDGGNPIMGSTLHHLTHAILFGQMSSVSAEVAESVMQLQPGTLWAELNKVLDGYPEQDPQLRATHFIMCERNPRWLFEGEDRARFFLWQTSPFLSVKFLREAMRVPAHFKEHYRLYRQFQKQLSPVCSQIADSNYGIPIGSAWFIPMLRLRQSTPAFLKRALGRFVPGVRVHPFQLPDDAVAQIDELSRQLPLSASAGRTMLSLLNCNEFLDWKTLVELQRMWRNGQTANGFLHPPLATSGKK